MVQKNCESSGLTVPNRFGEGVSPRLAAIAEREKLKATFGNLTLVHYGVNRSLQHAVGRAYANLLPPGRYPVAVIFVEVPLDQVDVNVHPQKSEVRFADPRAVYEAVSIAIGTALRPAPWLPGSGEARPAP